MCKILGIMLTVMKQILKLSQKYGGFFWSEFYDGIAMPLKSTMCFVYLQLFFTLFTV